MKASTKFNKCFYKLPAEARKSLIYHYEIGCPLSLNVIRIEVHNKTKLGKKLLMELGFKDD